MTADQEKVAILLKAVESKKEEIAKASRPVYKTNLTYPFSKTDTQNIASITEPAQLVAIFADLLQKVHFYEEAGAILGIETQFRLGVNTTYTLKEWSEDLKTRLSVINIRKSKDTLALLEAKLLALESPEVKSKKQLNEIEELLKTM